MSSKIIQGLSEAYNSIYSQQKKSEMIKNVMNNLIKEGYDLSDITENDLYEICVNEGIELSEVSVNFGQLASLLNKAKGAATNPQVRQAATGLLQTGQRAAQQTAAPILTGVTRRVQSAAQTGQQAFQQATQAAAQAPKGPVGKFMHGVKRTAELATGMAPGSGSRLRRSLVVGGTGGVLGSTGLGQAALNAAGKFIQGGTSAVMGGEKPKPTSAPADKPIQLPAGYKMVNGKVVKENILIKKHLLDEGYASTEKQAEVIAAYMSDNWKQSILGDVE